jgi:hypothetical protein
MPASLVRGVVVYRTWTEDEGLHESEAEFHTLEELYSRCLGAANSNVINRLVLTGEDERGEARSVIFTFRAMTVGDGRLSDIAG